MRQASLFSRLHTIAASRRSSSISASSDRAMARPLPCKMQVSQHYSRDLGTSNTPPAHVAGSLCRCRPPTAQCRHATSRQRLPSGHGPALVCSRLQEVDMIGTKR